MTDDNQKPHSSLWSEDLTEFTNPIPSLALYADVEGAESVEMLPIIFGKVNVKDRVRLHIYNGATHLKIKKSSPLDRVKVTFFLEF